ncbi:MAG TPA: MarR family transcriptional regulator [Steroidobacteraceae bacterium]|nr:MarR family transcriptional regulator [Steroidobacteraceae bacterium]
MTRDPKAAASATPCNATALRKAQRRLTQLYDGALEDSGLRSTQLSILVELAARTAHPPTMAELAQALVMDRSALGHNLRPLEREGLLVLQEGDTDRRQRHVVLTSRGKSKCQEALRRWRTAQDRFEQVFGRAEAAALRGTLLRIAHDERLATLKD